MIGVLMASSLLNVAYLLSVVGRGFFAGFGEGAAAAPGAGGGLKEAPLLCVIPLWITALGCVALFFYADALYRLLEPIIRP
jgi:multicomponent Na+:H+ antiporter subunit D